MTDVKQRLTEAAALLDHYADRAEYHEGWWAVGVAGPVASTQWLGPSHDVLTATWPQAVLVDMCSPALARLLAQWLRTEAALQSGDEDHTTCDIRLCEALAALTVADEILKKRHAPQQRDDAQ